MGNGIIKHLKYIVDCVLELIYDGDNSCTACGKQIYSDDIICDSCYKKIKFCSEAMTIVRDNISIMTYSTAYYSGIIKELVLNLKYRGNFISGELLSKYMQNTIASKEFYYDIIAYVPCSSKSLRNRGYNQSKFLAVIIGEEQNKPVCNCLKKIVETKDQIGLDGLGRWENLLNAFSVINENKIKNKKILLIDDVITTGATAFYCAKLLLNSGAEEVRVLTAAKSKI